MPDQFEEIMTRATKCAFLRVVHLFALFGFCASFHTFMRAIRFGSEDLLQGIQALFSSAKDMKMSVGDILNDPGNVFEDDDSFARDVPPLLDACIEELGHMLQKCKTMEKSFAEFLAWIHPASTKAVKTMDVLQWFEFLIKCIRECNERNEALWVEDEVSVDSNVSAATMVSPQNRLAMSNLKDQINDDSLEEFLAESAKRIGIQL